MPIPMLASSLPSLDWKSLLNVQLGDFALHSIGSALISLLLCLFVIRFLMRIATRLLQGTHIETQIQKYILTAVKVILYIITLIIVMDSLGVPISSLVALLSVCGLAVSLAVEDVLANVAGGLLILSVKPFVPGDFIEADGVSGTVAEIALHSTKLDTPDGRRIIIPNKGLSAGKLINYTSLGQRRAEQRVSASYDAAIPTVLEALLEAAANTPHALTDPAPSAQVESYGESAIEYSVRCWCTAEDYWDVHYSLMLRIKESFDRHGIEMTYNHLNVHIKNS